MKRNHLVLLVLAGVAAAAAIWLLRRLEPWEELEKASGFLVNLALLAGAAAAIVKFQLYNLLGHRWRSDLSCEHHRLADGNVLFTADYTITNTGQRPLILSQVRIRLLQSQYVGTLLMPDPEKCLAERTMELNDRSLKGLFQVEPGERSIFTLRCRLPELDEVVFVQCGLDLPHRRVPAAYTGLYVKDAKREARSLPTQPPTRIPAPAIFSED